MSETPGENFERKISSTTDNNKMSNLFQLLFQISLPRENVIIPRLIVSNTSIEIKCDKSKSINEDYANSNRVQDEVPLTDSEHKETYFDDSNLGEQQ
ncbi:unnamed protein product [Rotaria sp. Silwood1]|nr:unnamed protein product [Rotaria sp. Silwood1]